MWLHRISAMLIWATTMIMALWVISKNNWTLGSGLHPAFGLSMLICVSLPIFGGIFARYTSENSRWNTAKTLKMKIGHKVLGYLVLFTAQITLILGGLSYANYNGSSLAKALAIIGMISVIILVIIFETLLQLFKKKEAPFIDSSLIITREDFNLRIMKGE